MRYFVLTLSLITPILALEPKDLLGLWKVVPGQGVAFSRETYFAEGGALEIRISQPSLNSRKNEFGTWTMAGDTLTTTLTHGWALVEGGEAEDSYPETDPVALKAEIKPGNPRKLTLSECSEEDGCVPVNEYEYVGAAKAFTIAAVSGSSSIRKIAGKTEIRRPGSSRWIMRVHSGSRSFDLTGRLEVLRAAP